MQAWSSAAVRPLARRVAANMSSPSDIARTRWAREACGSIVPKMPDSSPVDNLFMRYLTWKVMTRRVATNPTEALPRKLTIANDAIIWVP